MHSHKLEKENFNWESLCLKTGKSQTISRFFFSIYEAEIGYKSEKKIVFIDDTQLAIPVSTGQYICVTISSSMVT